MILSGAIGCRGHCGKGREGILHAGWPNPSEINRRRKGLRGYGDSGGLVAN